MRIWLYVCIPMLCAACGLTLGARQPPPQSAPVPPPLIVTRQAEISCRLKIPPGPPDAKAATAQDDVSEDVAYDRWVTETLDAVAAYARCVVKQSGGKT